MAVLIPLFAEVILEACGSYHTLNTQLVRSPIQAALSNVYLRQFMFTLECQLPSPRKLQVHWIRFKLFKFVTDHVYVQLKSMDHGSDTIGLRAKSFIEHPVHSINKSSNFIKCMPVSAHVYIIMPTSVPAEAQGTLGSYQAVQTCWRSCLFRTNVHDQWQ